MVGILDFFSPIITKVLDFIPDPAQKLAASEQMMAALHQWDADQTQINIAEASNPSIWVSGWRPFIGWMCGAAFAYKFVLQPFMVFIIVLSGVKFDVHSLPILDWGEMSTVLLGLLGLSGMKTFEKLKGV